MQEHQKQALRPQIPPPILYHGTGENKVINILKIGIDKRNRKQVHLFENDAEAIIIAERHTTPIIFEINAQAMLADGFEFYKSKNNIWLTDHVPVKYLSFKKSALEKKVEQYIAHLKEFHPHFKIIGSTCPFTITNGHIFSQINAEGHIGLMLPETSRNTFRKDIDATPFITFGNQLEEFVCMPTSIFNNPTLFAYYLEQALIFANERTAKKPM